jgi:sigma-B regulation protein RsbU (phosphoserine phosphatase)
MDDFAAEVPCGLLAFNPQGEILAANRALKQMLGRNETELAGGKIDAVLTASSRIFHQTHLLPMLRLQQRVEEIYLTLKHKDGQPVPALANVSVQKYAGSDAIVCAFIAVRERGKYEQEILAAKRQAEEALQNNEELKKAKHELELRSRELDGNLANLERRNLELRRLHELISHDLREPVRRIIAFSQYLLEESANQLSEDGCSALQRIGISCERINNLLHALQDFLSVEDDEEAAAQVDLNSALATALLRVQSASAMPIVIEKDELPVVWGYPSQLITLFEILIRQSAARALETSASIEIRGKQIQENAYQRIPGKYRYVDVVQIEYSDNGPAYECSNSDALFELLRKQNNEYADAGLAVCRKIVENHHGSICVEPGSSKTAALRILLPISNPVASRENAFYLSK